MPLKDQARRKGVISGTTEKRSAQKKVSKEMLY